MEIYDFFKAVVNVCNNSRNWACENCQLQTQNYRKPYCSCRQSLFDYIVETDKVVGQKIYDEFVRLGIDIIPDLSCDEGKKMHEEQLKVFEKYYKNNSLEIE